MSHITGKVQWILRLEGLSILLIALYLYHSSGFSWATFAIFFLVPDISFFGYLINNKVGAIAYNAAHSLIGACITLALSVALDGEIFKIAGLIWVAHISFDRALGYGLKYVKGFGYTHLGLIGKLRDA